ncbi:MAG: hypothetical protein MZU91_12010 [Desulfosudis oleivorans]|nr:hypothetical protein [Desulfosudis oleivorans]
MKKRKTDHRNYHGGPGRDWAGNRRQIRFVSGNPPACRPVVVGDKRVVKKALGTFGSGAG